MGIEPTPRAWEAPILPLNYTRILMGILVTRLRRFQQKKARHKAGLFVSDFHGLDRETAAC